MVKQKSMGSWFILFLLVSVLGFLFVTQTRVAYTTEGRQITVFTRTPVPDPPTATPDSPPPATATSDPGGGGGGGGGENPTSIPNPGSTTAAASPTPSPIPVTIGPTPLGGYLPTAEPCATEPTVMALGNVFVRSGPGTDYQATASLQFLEVRPIRGRAQNAEWWLIDLGDGTVGWVANLAIQVQGYTGLVPVVTPPALANGMTPTPGPLWNPTPNPVCTVVPTATATATATQVAEAAVPAAASATPMPTTTHTPAPSPTTGLATVAVVATNTVPAAATTIVPTSVPPTPAISNTTLTPTAPSTDSNAGTASNGVLYAGLGLIVTAGVVAVVTRMRR